MDFYAPQVKWIKQQKNIEKKLFDELVTKATKEYGLQYIKTMYSDCS